MSYIHFVAKAAWDNVIESDDAPILSRYDGIDSQENFVDYLNWGRQKDLAQKLEWGYATFRYSAKSGLLIVTTYKEKEVLQDSEVVILQEYTRGQWSDGIGENFEQQEVGDVYLSMWFPGQDKILFFRTDEAELSKEFILTKVNL